jgi:hypothetical protein
MQAVHARFDMYNPPDAGTRTCTRGPRRDGAFSSEQ